MSSPTIPIQSRRGRPRSQRADRAILKAASALLAERGLSDLTIEDVASRARVGKASIYRRWPNKYLLAFDTFLEDYLAGQPIQDTGTLRGDLLALARDWIRQVTRTASGRILASLLAEALTDDVLAAAWRDRFVLRVRHGRAAVVSRAIARGEIAGDADADLLLDMFYGALYHRFINGHLPLNDRFARSLAGAVAGAAAASRTGVVQRAFGAEPAVNRA